VLPIALRYAITAARQVTRRWQSIAAHGSAERLQGRGWPATLPRGRPTNERLVAETWRSLGHDL